MSENPLNTIHYDLLIVGGGINGAAVAYLSALAGKRVLVVDKGDFAGGTSSKSTKLLHGGIRYLENFEFDLVAESLKERFIQYKSLPHLVKPMEFIVPVYKNGPRPLWMMQAGVWLYDLLSGPYSFGRHRHLSKAEVLALLPGLAAAQLTGGVSYFDAQMDDARIVLENILMAKKSGAQALNYVAVESFLKEGHRIFGARLRDLHTKRIIDVKADKILVAAGPWTDAVKKLDAVKEPRCLRPTKGAHIICRLRLPKALLLQNAKDRRVFFAIPFGENALIGTTDTDYAASPDEVAAGGEDIEYLLSQAAMFLPEAGLTTASVIATFAGVRPLAHEAGSPSKVSRKHVFEQSRNGVYYLYGGKYTTYRAMALECVHKLFGAVKGLPARDTYPLYGSGLGPVDAKALSLQYGIEAATIGYLTRLYGSRFTDVLALVKKDAALKARLCTCSPAIRAQVVYAKDVEMARCPADIYERRLALVYNDCPTKQCKAGIEEMFASIS